jgi:hypothetical protein
MLAATCCAAQAVLPLLCRRSGGGEGSPTSPYVAPRPPMLNRSPTASTAVAAQERCGLLQAFWLLLCARPPACWHLVRGLPAIIAGRGLARSGCATAAARLAAAMRRLSLAAGKGGRQAAVPSRAVAGPCILPGVSKGHGDSPADPCWLQLARPCKDRVLPICRSASFCPPRAVGLNMTCTAGQPWITSITFNQGLFIGPRG